MSVEDLGRAELATLVREHLLAGHLIDRAGMPHVLGAHGADGMGAVAIDEWMGASPVYSRRMRTLLRIEGDDVEAIFKGMQLDIGAPPQFLDFRYEVIDATRGEFRLASCGALLDAEPMGDEIVHLMCHTIEDPTMDATAWATNPRARMRPAHRPPRVPGEHEEHCRWVVTIDPEVEPVPEPAPVARVLATQAAQLPLADPGAVRSLAGDDEGATAYDGALQDDIDLAGFARPTLVAVDDEVCLQGHLLVLSGLIAVAERWGHELATEVGVQQLVGSAGVVAERLVSARGLAMPGGGGVGGAEGGVGAAGAIVELLALHPALLPQRYTGVTVEAVDAVGDVAAGGSGATVRLRLAADAPALAEAAPGGWLMLLADPASGADVALDAIVAAVDPTARMRRVEPAVGDAVTWELAHDVAPLPEPGVVSVVRFSTGAEFRFDDR